MKTQLFKHLEGNITHLRKQSNILVEEDKTVEQLVKLFATKGAEVIDVSYIQLWYIRSIPLLSPHCY